MHRFRELVDNRIAVDEFEPGAAISTQEVEAIVETAMQAPSAFNAQQWRFVAVTDRKIKLQLKNATIETNQQRVEDAGLIIIVLGDRDGHKQLPTILRQSVEAGLLHKDISVSWLELASTVYGSNPELAKTEALRSACLAAMLLMLAALEIGYATCPIGFDQQNTREVLHIDTRYELVMMIAVGHAKSKSRGRRPRLQLRDVLGFNQSHQFLREEVPKEE